MSSPATNGGLGHYKTIPLAYDNATSIASARALVFALVPEWEKSDGEVEFVPFKDGITNTLLKATKRQPGKSEHEIDQEAILLRAYGNGTDILIDREREANSHALLSSLGLAPPLLARFNNGLLYRYIEGYACSPADLRRPEVWHSTAKHLGQWHSTLPTAAAKGDVRVEKDYPNISGPIPNHPKVNVWTTMQKWILALPNNTKAERSRNAALQKELESMTRLLGNARGLDNGAYVISHCDLLSGNVIVHPGETATSAVVSFIDYEYATPAPAAFDIANHFSEWGGLECEYEVLPTRSERREFLRDYVSSYRSFSTGKKQNGRQINQLQPCSVDDDVEQLMHEVDDFRGMPGFYWGIWALIQTLISQIDFDYASYAEKRLGEYWAWKDEAEGRRVARGVEQPVREKRWAQER